MNPQAIRVGLEPPLADFIKGIRSSPRLMVPIMGGFSCVVFVDIPHHVTRLGDPRLFILSYDADRTLYMKPWRENVALQGPIKTNCSSTPNAWTQMEETVTATVTKECCSGRAAKDQKVPIALFAHFFSRPTPTHPSQEPCAGTVSDDRPYRDQDEPNLYPHRVRPVCHLVSSRCGAAPQ
jgi:hypothetical protein